jgi:hypothetical protein
MSKTPIEHRKLRNACFSGHFPGEEKRCPLCQEARFNTLVSGYHGDEPDQADIDRYLSNVETNNAEDHAFVVSWIDSKKSAKAFANVFNAFVELGKPLRRQVTKSVTLNAAIATVLSKKFGAAAPAINANYVRRFSGDIHGKPGNSAPPKEQASLLARALMQRLK